MRSAAELIYSEGGFESGSIVVLDDGAFGGVVGEADMGSDANVEEWGEVALLPGTVNAHGHAFQNLFKGFADDRAFDSWRDDVLYPFSEQLDGDAIYAGSVVRIRRGTSCGSDDHSRLLLSARRWQRECRARNPCRARSRHSARVRGAPSTTETRATDAPARFRETAQQAAERTIELAEAHEDDPLVSIQPAPHSLHAASPETIAVALEVADRLAVPCHLHLAEAAYEREQVVARYGTTPVRLLEREGLLRGNLVAIHTVWVDDEELDMLAEQGVGVVHCPGANAFLGDGVARVPEMLLRGIRVGLGPDGGCANNRQSVFDEMRMASLMAKARLCDGGALDASTAFALGTTGGADLLGVSAGSIAPGKLGDLVALDLGDLSLQPLKTLEHQVVNSMLPTAIERVAVGGEIVVERGRLTRMDHAEIRARIQQATGEWTRP